MNKKKQTIIIAAIAAVTLILGGMILWSDRNESGHDEHGHEHHEAVKGHAEKDHHDDQAKGHNIHDEHHEKEKSADAHHGEEHHDDADHAGDKKIAFTAEQLRSAGIGIHTVKPARIKIHVQLPGEIRFNEDRTAHIVPRVAGVVESVMANLGDQVKKGQVLAVIASSAVAEYRSVLQIAQRRHELAKTTFDREKKLWEEKISAEQDYLQARQALQEAQIELQKARQQLSALGADSSTSGSLNRFEIRAPFAGTVVEKRITLGESVAADAAVFTVSDLSTVWAEVTISPKDLGAVRVGETANVVATAFDSAASGKVSYVGALLGEQTRTAKARIVLPNPKGAWRPGLFVNVSIVTDDIEVPLAVSADAVHTLEEKNVVFVEVPGGFLLQSVKVGVSDGKFTEILDGLKPGIHYAADGSFVIKSEQGKGSAEHSH